jgi:hypothetical protein
MTQPFKASFKQDYDYPLSFFQFQPEIPLNFFPNLSQNLRLMLVIYLQALSQQTLHILP